MEKIAYYYKDAEPIETISRIRSELASLNIITQETWKSVGTDFFSVHLSVFDTTITSNGKGCTKDMALASAYGELAERLSFLLPFRVSPFFNFFYETIHHFSRHKDSNLFFCLDFRDWIKSDNASKYFFQLQNGVCRFFSEKNSCSFEDFALRWSERANSCECYNLATRFLRLNNSYFESGDTTDTLIVPYAVLDYYYGSNGMCSGNSEPEALIQGICEILERYVQRRVILGYSDSVFDITSSCLLNSTEIKRGFKLMQNLGYELKILEYPLYDDISVIAARLKKPDSAYYVSFGCHPDIMIGAERAVLELFQGYNLDDLEYAFEEKFAIGQSEEFAQCNYMNLLKFGNGQYPANFIMGIFPDKELSLPKSRMTNEQMLRFLLKTLDSENISLYCAKGISLGVYCFHVLAIGMSEAEQLLPAGKIRNSKKEDLYSDLSQASESEAEQLAEQAVLLFESGSDTLEKMLDIYKYTEYTNTITSVRGISTALFIAMLYIRARKWRNAATYLHLYIRELSNSDSSDVDNLDYYCVLQVILEEKACGMNAAQIKNNLRNVPKAESLLEMVTCQETLFSDMPSLSSPELLLDSNSLRNTVIEEKCKLENLIRRSWNGHNS